MNECAMCATAAPHKPAQYNPVVVQQRAPQRAPAAAPTKRAKSSSCRFWFYFFVGLAFAGFGLLVVFYIRGNICALVRGCSANCPCDVGGACTSEAECVPGLTCPTFTTGGGGADLSAVGQVCVDPTSGDSDEDVGPAAPPSEGDIIQLVQVHQASNQKVNEAVLDAVAQWNEIMNNTFPDIPLPESVADFSDLGCPDHPMEPGYVVRGVTVLVSLGDIDGPNGVLGSAASCFHSRNSDRTLQPRIGFLNLDQADLELMLTRGSLVRVLMHEIGHVLGINKSIWVSKSLTNLNKNLAFTENFPNPTDYIGEHGDEAYRRLGGLRAKLPIETGGGSGTVGSHFSEDEFNDELMTGFENGRNAISGVTLGALKDLGYDVDLSKAEDFEIKPKQRRLDDAEPLIPLNEQEDEEAKKHVCVMELDGQITCGGV